MRRDGGVVTPSAQTLIRKLEAEAAAWDDVTTTDVNAIARNRAEAMRNGIDYAIAQVKFAIPAIEEEAIAGVDADIVAVETSLGWRAA